jgi:Domain of unknown function (DUF397)
MIEATPWIKATASGTGSQCIELRRSGDAVQVRNSKDPSGPILDLTPQGLRAWLEDAKRGHLDHLTG